jgi:hypothetical protein
VKELKSAFMKASCPSFRCMRTVPEQLQLPAHPQCSLNLQCFSLPKKYPQNEKITLNLNMSKKKYL